MRVVYVAGPFRGPDAWAIKCNIHRAEIVGSAVARAGHMPLIPHANTANFHGFGDDQFWIEGTLELLRRCDAVVLVHGWENSVGTLGEIAEARKLGIPVFEDVGDLLAHIEPAQIEC